MVNNTKEMLRSIVILSAIALISGILLAIVYQFTRLTDEEINQNIFTQLDEIYAAGNGWEKIDFDSGDQNVKGIYRAKGEDYYVVLAVGKGNRGDLEMYVSFEGRQILKATPGKVVDDPGYKEKIFDENYLNQFKVNIDSNLFDSYGTDNEFDAAAGATYSSNGALQAINNAVKAYKEYTAEEA